MYVERKTVLQTLRRLKVVRSHGRERSTREFSLVPLLRPIHLRSVASSSSSTRHVDLASHLTRGSVRTLIQSIAMHADLETGIHMLKLTLLAIKISPGYNR